MDSIENPQNLSSTPAPAGCPGEARCEAIRRAVTDDAWLLYFIRVFRHRGLADSKFDFNLIEGQIKEETLKALLTGKGVEVKRDFSVSRTGNVAIELGNGETVTGIGATEAEWVALVLDGDEYRGDVIVMMTTPRLLEVAAAFGVSSRGGDNNRSVLKLVPVSNLLNPVRNSPVHGSAE